MISFGSKAQQQALDALIAGLDEVLGPLGFDRAGKRTWRRKAAWRIEEIDLVTKGGTSRHLLPSFRVLLPRTESSETGEKYQHVAQVNVARLLRPDAGPDFDIAIPSSSFGRDKFVRIVVADVKEALPWFEQFATPEACKANLGKFLKFGCPAHLDAEKFLSSLVRD